jgi:hypothetical protein
MRLSEKNQLEKEKKKLELTFQTSNQSYETKIAI